MASSMNPKPLTYPGLKCVLQYMEANFRTHLALRLPSIKTAEKLTPLSIDFLDLQPLELRVNETTYKLGVIRTCEMDWLLKPFNCLNGIGGENCDVDEYGMSDKTSSKVVLPGDIVLGDDPLLHRPNYEAALRRLLVHKGLMIPEANDRFLPVVPRFEVEDVEDGYDRFEDVIDPRADLVDHRYEGYKAIKRNEVRMVDRYQAFILQKRLQEENAPPPFTNYIQLSVQPSLNTEDIKKEHLVYEKKIHETMKYLMNKIFGGSPGCINVKRFRIRSVFGTLRVPENFEVRTQNLEIEHKIKAVMNSIDSIINESSFSLKSMSINGIFVAPEDFLLPVVRNAEKLVVHYFSLERGMQTIIQLRNHRVDLTFRRLRNQDIITFVNNWIEAPRGVGTLFTFNLNFARLNYEELFTLLKELPNAEIIEQGVSGYDSLFRFVNIPIGHTSDLKVSVKKGKKRGIVIWTLYFEEVEHRSLDSD